jgi:signal transduction histidine kinase
MNSYAPEDALVLIHDLRQPLGNIGLCVSYLRLLLESGAGVERVQEQLQAIQDQVDRAALLLDEAGAEVRGLRDQPSLDRTKPETAAVA